MSALGALGTLEYDYQKRQDELFDPKTTILNKGNFTVPGQGQSPDYCHTPYISHIHASGNSALEMIISCKLWRCPSCYRLKVDSEVFKYAVLLECYSLVTGDRPFRAVASMDSDKAYSLTLDEYRGFRRNAKDRLKRNGVTAGFKLDHPFRIKKSVQQAVRVLCGEETSSGGFWNYILNPSSINEINNYLDTDFKSWRDLVNFSPHVHYLLFPGHQKISGDKNIVITKLQKTDGSYTLDNVSDIVQHLRYLLTHCGILVNAGKSRMEPAGVFGDLRNWKPEDYLTPEEIQDIQLSVLNHLNEKRTTPYTVDDMGELCYLRDKEEEKTAEDAGYFPLKEFIAYDECTGECIDSWLSSIRNPDNAVYVEYLLSEYSRILKDTDIPQKKRRLFLGDLRDPPNSFKITKLNV
ncbi:hypothetical protein SAMN04488589_0511 [Methanolobus vulcani]|uniref:Uncharacterized protein n=1 Tax=Methanolobus vulcani TaxID=38026 RepID=A0A7Z7AUS3_9EURY|nr:hypothetical protein [Methanolobus vulcani]SDF43546.1 hypothetical protein SAMN04488589_0511 [Methanolobus vulcani]